MSAREKVIAIRDTLIELDQSLGVVRSQVPPSAHSVIDDFRIRATALAKILTWVESRL